MVIIIIIIEWNYYYSMEILETIELYANYLN